MVTATQIEGVNTTIIKCEFIVGSRATGCMVVLIYNETEGQDAYYNLTRNANIATLTVTLKQSLSCYNRIEAFDIESDGSVGSLTIPGQLRSTSSSQNSCTSIKALPGNNTIIVIIVQ